MKMCENEDHVMSRCREGYVKVDTHTDIQAQTYTHSQFDEEEFSRQMLVEVVVVKA